MKWSIKSDKCISCGTNTIEHVGKGYCKKCYSQRYEKLHRSKCSICKRERVISTRKNGKIICKSCHKKFYYKIKKRKCSICGKINRIDKISENKPVCLNCYEKFFHNRPKDTCYFCGEFREREGYRKGYPICGYCYRKYYKKPKRICDNCRRLDYVVLIKNEKMFCMRCYKKIRREHYLILNRIRRTRIKNKEDNISELEFKMIMERDKRCVYCGSTKNLTFDHIIPVSKNGRSEFNNYVISCSNCNTSKNNKDVFIWCKQKGIKVPQIIIELLKEGGRRDFRRSIGPASQAFCKLQTPQACVMTTILLPP